MNEILSNDKDQLDMLLAKVQDQALAFLHDIAEKPTSINDQSIATLTLPDYGQGGLNALHTFNAHFEKLINASSGPRYWGFVTGGATPASLMGDWLASVYDQNTQAVEGQGDVSAKIELATIQLLLDLFGLPHTFNGGFVTGATMSNFTCMAVARQWMGKYHNIDIAREGIQKPLKVLAATPHSSLIKSLSMLGIGSANVVIIPCQSGNREAIDIEALTTSLEQMGGRPCILVTSAGTVNTVDFDDFIAIQSLKQKYSFWWHIDAAFGAFAACSPKYKYLTDGWEDADSITVDCHKWLNVPYENALFFIKENHASLQVSVFQNSNAPYLGNPAEKFNYLNFLPENSRRLNALPVWFTLMAYGRRGYQDIVENAVVAAQYFGSRIDQHPILELLAPVRLNNVCFSLKESYLNDDVFTFLQAINASGKVFMTPTVYQGRKGIRAAFVNWRTTMSDVDLAFDIMNEAIMTLKNQS